MNSTPTKATSNIVKLYDKVVDVVTITKGNTVHFDVTDYSKYYYEKDHIFSTTRKMNKKGIISFDNIQIDISGLEGVRQVLEELNNAK
jgi:hypothetical protein